MDQGSRSTMKAAEAEVGLAHTLASLAPSGPAEKATPVPTGSERFAVGELIGEGGMGRVVEADDRQFGRRVALKEMHGGGQSAESARRFAVEALVTGNLEHPGIPAVYERGVRDGKPYYAMRRVEGRPLSKLLDDARSLTERLALAPIVGQVAQTLAFAHGRGVVHRDIKPDNILVGAHGDAVVVDWGIARVRGAAAESVDAAMPTGGDGQATVHGAVMGTPAYMAPEQARGDVAAIDERTDVFALGALLYHVLAGRAPFSGQTSMATLAAALEGGCEPIDRAAPNAPAGLRAIVTRAMSRDPADRPRNATEFVDLMGSFMVNAMQAKPPSLVIRAVVGIVSLAALVMGFVGIAFAVRVLPSLHEMGGGSPVLPYLTVITLGLAVTEWRTKGRYRLVPLMIGLCVATFLGGVATTFTGYVVVAESCFAARAAGREVSGFLLEGVREASGSIALAAQLSALQAIVIAIAARVAGSLPRS